MEGGYDEALPNKTGSCGDDSNTPVLLVGNFGDGRINVYSQDGQFKGQLKDHHTIAIQDLWALVFPPASAISIDPNRLYFTARPDNAEDGSSSHYQRACMRCLLLLPAMCKRKINNR